MDHLICRRDVLRASLALGTALAIPSARACEFFATTLKVTHPWTRASAEDATSAIVCMRIDEVTQTDRLIGVETPVADGADMIDAAAASRSVSLLIPQGQETNLSEAGLRLRLVRLKHPLLIGRTYPMRLQFEKGGWLTAELNIDYMPNT